MKNVNQLLQNSVRNELMGQNMFLFQEPEQKYPWDFESRGSFCPAHIWAEPEFAMKGVLGLGHHTDGRDAVCMEIYRNGKRLTFHAVRNVWTPAYMDTIYRCEPGGDYRPSGLLVIRERKCITKEDVFVSEITAVNDDREEMELEFRLNSSFTEAGDSFYHVDLRTEPEGLLRTYRIEGYFYVSSREGCRFQKKLPPFGSCSFRYSAAYGRKDRQKLKNRCERALAHRDIFCRCEKDLNRWFQGNVPELRTDRLEILKAYYYRWYVVYKNTFSPAKVIPEHFVRGRAIYESSFGGWYGCPIGLPVGMQVEETKWMKDKTTARQQLENWKRGGGCYQSYIQFTPLAAWHFYELDRDLEWLKRGYPVFKKYTFARLNRKEPRKLPVTTGSWPTGAEYQPSFYQHTPVAWDWRNDVEMAAKTGGEFWPLYRLDEIAFSIGNVLACGRMAGELGLKEEEKEFSRIREELLSVLKERFWNQEKGMFYDVDAKTGRQCDNAACYDSFAPFLWDLVSGEPYDGAMEKLLDEKRFWGRFPVTTVEKTCPMFWADNCITGPCEASKANPHSYGCCWNGPVWPFADTLVLTALGDAARRKKEYRRPWLAFFEAYTELHFLCGDSSVPDILEHYRYSDGTPFSSTHDYFHSEYIDLLMRYWAGIYVDNNKKLVFQPFTREAFEIDGVVINSRAYNFRQYYEGKKLRRRVEEVPVQHQNEFSQTQSCKNRSFSQLTCIKMQK